MLRLICTTALALVCNFAQLYCQQSVGIGTQTPHASAILEVKSNNKGLMIPRVNLLSETDIVTVTNPALSLLLYNSNNSLPDGEGFYFWNGSKWSKLTTRTNLENLVWGVSGNSGTDANVHFIGTTDNRALSFRTNNILSGKIEPANNNTYWGQSAGASVTTGNNNTFLGQNAGMAVTTGTGNLFAGHNAGVNSIGGIGNVFLGQGAGKSNLYADKNVFVGEDAGFSNTDGSGLTAVGNRALYLNTYGFNNTAIGFHALSSNESGSFNTAVGDSALANSRSSSNTAIGAWALKENFNGALNTAIGQSAMTANTNGHGNTAVGYAVMFQNITGTNNTAIGRWALEANTTGDQNSAVGYLSLNSNTTGNLNTAIGSNTLQDNTTGYENTALGYQALYKNTTGFYNVAVGRTALLSNTNGERNAAFGADALRENVSGFQNTACGNSALEHNLVGDRNTSLGFNSGPAIGQTSLNNTTSIGAGARVTTSNTMVFGDDDINRWAFGLTTTNAQHALEVGDAVNNGNGAYLTQGGVWTNASDLNKKEDFSNPDKAELLQKILQLDILRWKYKGSEEYHIGPMAQDFYKLFGLGTGEKGISTVDPAGIALAAIQEQQRMIEKQGEMIRQLTQKVEELVKSKE
jgi:trimeric autotransporter adhesin